MAGRDPAQAVAPEWIDSPEFQAAVQAAAVQIVGQIAPARAASGDDNWHDKLALAIAGLTDQGSGRKRIDPSIVAARRAAKERLFGLLSDLRAQDEMPEWRLRNKVQLVLPEGETVLDPVTIGADRQPKPVEIAYLGAPNMAMEPINDSARRVFALYCEATGSNPGAARPGWTVTRSGVVLEDAMAPDGKIARGRLAASIIRRDSRNSGDPLPVAANGNDQRMPHTAAIIRRNGPTDVVETRVLGSLADPARQMA